MRFEDLSVEDQALVNTDFGDLEKVAETRVAVAEEMYSMGFDKLATATADEFDKAAEAAAKEEHKEDDKEEHDEEKKAASEELGKIIEKGYYDGLRKLGSERHGNELHYILPFIEEKVAAAGMQAALNRFHEKVAAAGKAGLLDGASKALKAGWNSAKSTASKGVDAVKGYHKGMAEDARKAFKGTASATGKGAKKELSVGQRAAAGGRAAAKASPYLLAGGGAAALAAGKKKDSDM